MSRKNQTSELKSRVMEVALGHFSEVGIARSGYLLELIDGY